MIRHVLIGLFAAVVAIVVVAVAQPEEPPAVTFDPKVVKIDDLQSFMPRPESLRRSAATRPANPLDQIVKEVNLHETPLADAIEFIRDATGANIRVNWFAIEEVGLERNEVTLKLHDVPASEVLSAILQNAGGNAIPMRYRYRDGIVHVSTPEYLDRDTEIRLYNVRDLLINAMRFHRSFEHAARGGGPAPSLAGTRVNGGAGITWQEGDLADQLRQLIMDTVDRDAWIEHGGRSASIHYWAGKFLIVQTPENQDEIERFLSLLREE
jgi:hypothetical protein